jgi:hypothetical protein
VIDPVERYKIPGSRYYRLRCPSCWDLYRTFRGRIEAFLRGTHSGECESCSKADNSLPDTSF